MLYFCDYLKEKEHTTKQHAFSIENTSIWVFCLSVFCQICIYDIIGIRLYLLCSNLPFVLNTVPRSFSHHEILFYNVIFNGSIMFQPVCAVACVTILCYIF